MIPIRNRTKELMTAIAVILILEFIAVLIFSKNVMTVVSHMGTMITLTIPPFWFYFEKIGWRQSFFRTGGWLCKTPDLRGRWEGSIDRKDERGPHKFVLEIRQTYTTLRCDTYSSRSSSHSLTGTILSDPQEEQFTLVYNWIVDAGKLDHEDCEPGLFPGTSILSFTGGKKQVLKGRYFTDRPKQQTRGDLKLTRTGYTLYSSFEEH